MKAEFRFKKIVVIEGVDAELEMIQNSLFTTDVSFIYKDATHEIAGKNIFKSHVSVIRRDKEIGEIKTTWKCEATIYLQGQNGMTKMFYLEKEKNIFNHAYILSDNFGNQLYHFCTDWKWGKFVTEAICTELEGKQYDESGVDPVLLQLVSLYTFKVLYYRRRAAKS